MLGVAITGLLAAFMAGMAANVSSFNTVFTYDIWQSYVVRDRPDQYYLRVGRLATVAGCAIAVGTAFIASDYNNIMDYLQTLFSFFNAPLFATFILGMFWRRTSPMAGGVGLLVGTASAVTIDQLNRHHVLHMSGQGPSFVAASAAFVMDIAVSVPLSLATEPKPDSELGGLVWALTPRVRTEPDAWYRSPGLLAGGVLALATALSIVFW